MKKKRKIKLRKVFALPHRMFDLCHYRLKFLRFPPFKVMRIFCNGAISGLKLEL